MLIKEYRIPLPLSVEEYKVAQLYMIAKKSREETQGAGSGVEIIVNIPYEDGPGGNGQYTHKIYHVGQHLPGWFKSLLPKSALTVQEEAWNAYPYTKTKYTCPFVEKFFIEIETKYLDDAGEQENIFHLGSGDLKARVVDTIDIVKDQLWGSDYKKEEDPRFFISEKTNRGPLNEDWIEEYYKAYQNDKNGDKQMMCAYKLCRVEFKYWGMQSKIEKFIHDSALRRVMLRAHRQAWVWQDECYGLTMEDIRKLERETQEMLAKRMAIESDEGDEDEEEEENEEMNTHFSLNVSTSLPSDQVVDSEINKNKGDELQLSTEVTRIRSPSLNPPSSNKQSLEFRKSEPDIRRELRSKRSSKPSLNSPEGGSSKSLEAQLVDVRIENIANNSEDETSDDEYYDAEEEFDMSSLTKWSSLESVPSNNAVEDNQGTSEKWLKKRTSMKLKVSRNVHSNHRANDVLVKEGDPQIITARFMYGPLDVVALTGEKVDMHLMKDMMAGEWSYLDTQVTDKTGRVTYTIPPGTISGFGIYPVKMIVRGDHTFIDFFLTIVPPKTECVVFSIDGSFTASVSVTGKDPKVRAGAVDVVRYWQELGYLIIYITGRPDMQQQRVISWLEQHNFPHGLVSFSDRLSTDPLKHKAEYLRHLIKEVDIVIYAAYGSSKDIWVYHSIGLKSEEIYIVGKVSKKQQYSANILCDGYAAHLSELLASGIKRQAQNSEITLPRGCFGLPGHGVFGGVRQRRSTKSIKSKLAKTTSFPLSDCPNTPSSSSSNTAPPDFGTGIFTVSNKTTS